MEVLRSFIMFKFMSECLEEERFRESITMIKHVFHEYITV